MPQPQNKHLTSLTSMALMAYIIAAIKTLTFLEVTYHAFKHQLNCPSNSNLGEGLTQLLDSFVLREYKKFHDSKMNVWRWLRANTINGHTYYTYGREAALDSIIYRL